MKKITALLIMAALVLSAAGCGQETPAETTTKGTEPTITEAQAAEDTPADNASDSAGDNSAENGDSDSAEGEISADGKYMVIGGVEQVIMPDDDSAYVIENGLTEYMKAESVLVPGNRARLAKVFKRAQNGEEITVAYLGGSITQGSTAGDDLCYAKLTTEWLKKQFPDAKIKYVNAGIGATGSYIGVFRTDRDVLCHEPDLVFIDFSVNDTTEHTDRNIESYDGVLRKIWNSASSPAIVTIAMTQDSGASFQDYHSEICKAYDIPMISYRNAILDVIKKGDIKWTDISDDNIHPNVTGHAVLTEFVTSFLQYTIDNLDSIDTENESDFSNVYRSEKFSTAEIIVPETGTPLESEGWDVITDKFGNFGGQWRCKSKSGEYKPLSFEVEAKSIGLFYGKLVTAAPILDIYVDGELVKTIDSRFPGGWGSYVEAEEVIEFDECGTHKVEIQAHSDGASAAIISAIAITK